jgi:hypothetical protein
MKHFRIIPDQRIENKNVEQMVKTMNIYKNPLQRWNGRGFNRAPFVSWEVMVGKDATTFHVAIPDEMESIVKKGMETSWPQSEIKLDADPFLGIKPNAVSRVELKHHSMFAIRVDRRENGFLHSVLETIKIMDPDDRVFIQVLCTPASLDWYTGSADAYRKFMKDGKMPKKIHIDGKELAREGVKVATMGVLGIIDTMVILTGGKPEKINLDDSDRAMMMKDGGLRPETTKKTRSDAFDVTIRVAIQSKNHQDIMKMIGASFREFDGDNQFIHYPLDASNMVTGWMRNRKAGIKVAKDYLSTPELARIIQMPSSSMSKKWGIESIDNLETPVSKGITSGGIKIGTHTQKGVAQDVFMPVDDWDELCLPRIAVGGMGQGKTKGFGANWLYQSVQNGFGGLAIDPAKGEIGDELQTVLDESQIYRINIAKNPICLDWCETEHSPMARNRLANTMISFFNSNGDDAGVQTQRYIRACVMGMRGSKLGEIVQMMNDMDYLQTCVDLMPDGFHKGTLQELIAYGEGRRMQILSPILNRLDMILGDTFLAQCMESDVSLDMVDILKMKKAVIIDVPKKDVGPEGVDIIVNILSTKIDLAMTLRSEEEQTPFFILFDEPHQYMKSHHTWKSACVESRKWRVGYIWMFHEWTQIDDKLRKIVRSALPHYHIYPSSKATYNDLKEELKPFDLDDCMKLKRWTAINILRTGGSTVTPFVAQMTPPPSKQRSGNTNTPGPQNSIVWTFPG